MNTRTRRILARAVTTLVLLSAVLVQVVRSPVPSEHRGAILEIELAPSPAAVDRLAPAGSNIRDGVIAAQARDPILIAAYWLLFMCFGLLLWTSGAPEDRIPAAVVFGGGTLGALFDLLENRVIAALLSPPVAAMLTGAEVWAVAKWLSIFAAAIGMSLSLSWRTSSRNDYFVLATLGGVLLLGGGLVGVFPPVSVDRISVAVSLVGVGLLFVGLLFVWEPEYICEETLWRKRKDPSSATESENEQVPAAPAHETDYLVEIAREVLEFIAPRIATGQWTPPAALKGMLDECRKTYAEVSQSTRKQQARAECRLHGEEAERWIEEKVAATSSAPHAPGFDSIDDDAAIGIIADVLARRPDLIPGVLKDIGAPDDHPPSLARLLHTVIELCQPRYRASGNWYTRLVAVFTGREYLALLRDRSETVAWELKTIHDELQVQDTSTQPPSSSPSGRSPSPQVSMGMLGTQAFSGLPTVVKTLWQPAAHLGHRSAARKNNPLGELLDDESRRKEFLSKLQKGLLTRPDLVLRLVEVSGAPAPFSLVFATELREIHASRSHRNVTGLSPNVGHASAAASRMELFGVALSGGGIRSATFNLGVLQGLAHFKLLHRVDYLSTVSGGGYIGAWLAAWIKRVRVRRANGRTTKGVAAIEELLANEPISRPDDRDVRPVRFLREYSNYLAPKTGFFSADTWALVAIWVRNTLLNQLVLVLALGGALLLPWIVWLPFSTPQATTGVSGLFAGFPVAMTCCAVLLITSAAVAGQQLRRFNLAPKKRAEVCKDMLGQPGVLLSVVLPAVTSAWLLSAVVTQVHEQFSKAPGFKQTVFLEVAGLFLLCHTVVAIGGQYLKCFRDQRVSGRLKWRTRMLLNLWGVLIIALAGLLGSVAGAGLVVLIGSLIDPLIERLALTTTMVSWHWVVWGLPVMIMIMSLVIVLKIGVLGRNLLDEHREWWSRVGAWLTVVNLSWIVLFAFAMYSAYVFALADNAIKMAIVASGGLGWALWTAAGVLLGKDSGGPAGVGAVLSDRRVRGWIVDLAPFVFIVGLLGLVSTAAFWLVIGVSPLGCTHETLNQQHWTSVGLTKHWLLAGPGLLLGAFLLSCRVDVNEFSMHHFYKNRLVRCYLGASREGSSSGALRSPDPFTGLDPADDVKLADLRVRPGECDPQVKEVMSEKPERNAEYVGPLPIINVALNLVTGGDLAWQERKAQSFSFTPIFSGYEYRIPSRQLPSRFANEGFRSSFLYGYPPFGIGLGTAVAISGAAASPNMGYHSSPALGFLMTMFNARLGWWMGNPRDKFNWLRSTPRRGLLYLVNELFGLTSDDTHFVNLSDGGHFENLGIYELVRRRCRYIVASDAEQDGALSFNGLGNAIRKCRLDLGTEITVRATRIHPAADTAYSTVHTVIGDIRYPDGQLGTLVYLKASVTGDEPTDVLEYGSRQHAFPHHSTADQFFDESQFESYRKLGVHVAKTTFALPFTSDEIDACERFNHLRDYWYPASAAIERHFSDHATQYDELLERVRKDPKLALVDAAFFGDNVPPANQRDPMFIGAALLDLMQRIFIDLDLEHDSDHPHNKGWMEIFRQWRKLESVELAWKATRKNYGRRFQWFVKNL